MADPNQHAPAEAQLTRRVVLLAGLGLAVGGCSLRRPATESASAPTPEPTTTLASSSALLQGPAAAQPKPVRTVDVVPRSRWTTARVGGNSDPMGAIRRVTLHHTGEHLSSTGIRDLDLIQRIERHHRNNLGWAAIGYHFLIGKDGTIYEGRPVDVQGAHCGGDNNRNNLGITLIGEFDHALPSPAQLSALTAFLAVQRARYGISKRDVVGHRDFKNTVCPGDRLYAWLQAYRRTSS
jgi:hypothetical protein